MGANERARVLRELLLDLLSVNELKRLVADLFDPTISRALPIEGTHEFFFAEVAEMFVRRGIADAPMFEYLAERAPGKRDAVEKTAREFGFTLLPKFGSPDVTLDGKYQAPIENIVHAPRYASTVKPPCPPPRSYYRISWIKFDGTDSQVYYIESNQPPTEGSRLLGLSGPPLLFTPTKTSLMLESSRGDVYVRISRPTVLQDGAMFMLGSTKFRVGLVTCFVEGDGRTGNGVARTLEIPCLRYSRDGQEICDPMMVGEAKIGRWARPFGFPHDGLMSRYHATLYRAVDSTDLILTDSASSNGSYVRPARSGLSVCCDLLHGMYFSVEGRIYHVDVMFRYDRPGR